jgi:hypothetical protein
VVALGKRGLHTTSPRDARGRPEAAVRSGALRPLSHDWVAASVTGVTAYRS